MMKQRSEQGCANCYFCEHKFDVSYCRLYPPIRYRNDGFWGSVIASVIIFCIAVAIVFERLEQPITNPRIMWFWILNVIAWLTLHAGYFMLVRRQKQAKVQSDDWCGQWKHSISTAENDETIASEEIMPDKDTQRC